MFPIINKDYHYAFDIKVNTKLAKRLNRLVMTEGSIGDKQRLTSVQYNARLKIKAKREKMRL